MKLQLKCVRLSHPKLFHAERFDAKDEKSKPRYGASFQLAKGDPQIQEIEKAINEAAKEAFGDKAGAMLASLKQNPQKYCFHDGDVKTNNDGDPIAPGCMVLAAHRRQEDGPPGTFHRYKDPATGKPAVVTEESGVLYAGCYVNASVEIWVQAGQYPGVRCSLRGVQFAKDGDAFGGSRPAKAEDFEALAEDEDMADLA